MARPWVFPHIPKCGGTSIRRALERTPQRCFFDYDLPPSHRPYWSEQCRSRNADFRLLDFSPFDVVYGHFPLERYDVPPEQVVLLLRHPLERTLSEFYFLRDLMPEDNLQGIARLPEILAVKSGQMDLLCYARATRADETYLRYLGRTDTAGFGLVGFTDHMARFVTALRKHADIDLGEVGRERLHPTRPGGEEAPTELRSLLAADIEWYERQRAHWLPADLGPPTT